MIIMFTSDQYEMLICVWNTIANEDKRTQSNTAAEQHERPVSDKINTRGELLQKLTF